MWCCYPYDNYDVSGYLVAILTTWTPLVLNGP
jgi:hypothetical protein